MNLFNFKGRTRRSEFWWFMITSIIVTLIWTISFYMIGMNLLKGNIPSAVSARWLLYVGALLSICIAIPALLFPAAQIRRMHDIEKSARLVILSYVSMFISMILFIFQIILGLYNEIIVSESNGEYNDNYILPFIAFLLITVILQVAVMIYSFKDSFKGVNKYGNSPKYGIE